MSDDATIPTAKVREALLQSPSGHLSIEEISSAYKSLRKSLSALLQEQVKPVVEEPTGDVLVGFSVRHPQAGTVWSPDDGLWGDGGSDEIPWAQLVGDAKPSDILLYQRVPYPQSDGAGATPTSPSPEVGVATSPPVPSPADKAWRLGYELGTENHRARACDILVGLRAKTPLVLQQRAIDKAIALIEADAEDTVASRGFPS